jgi:hypothetical protein
MSAYPMALPEACRVSITDRPSGEAWLRALVGAGLEFHLEDDPGDIINIRTGEDVFAREDVAWLRDCRDALYDLEWGEYDCPIGFMLDLIEARDADVES